MVAYSTHTWTTSEPITQEKMNNIHAGIDSALSNAANAATAASSAATAASNAASAASDAMAKAIQVENTVSYNQQKINHGESAWAQLVKAGVTVDGSGNITSSLDNRLDGIDQSISNLSTNYTTVYKWITNAISMNSQLNYDESQVLSLADRIGKMNYNINVALQNSSSALSHFSESNATNILIRLQKLDGNPGSVNALPNHTVQELITEIYGAHVSTKILINGGINKEFNDLNERFEDSEEKIINLTSNKVNTADIRNNTNINNFSYTDIDKPLSAKNGKDLREIIGGNYDPYNSVTANRTTVTKAIETAQENATNAAEAYVDGLLGTDFTTTDTVSKTISDLSDSISDIIGTDSISNTIKGRIAALETSVDTATTGLKDRMTTAEGQLTTLNGDVNTAGSVLNTVNTKIAELVDSAPAAFDTLGEIAAWIQNDATGAAAMASTISGHTTAIEGLDTRLTAIDNPTDGKMKIAEGKISTLEITIGDSSSGLVKSVADNTSAISNINAAITTLQGKDTVVIGKASITYNNDGIPTNIGETPSPDKDYLLQKDDDKYYYWRYINNSWELISGAGGGGGTGTSSGVIVANLPNASDADENTDYFVGSNETGYLHYRFTTIDNVKQAVLIGVDPENIKRYNIEKIISGDKSYLRLYEFNYGEGNTINLDNTDVATWVASTSYAVDDLVLYQGYFYKCLTANNDAEWAANKWERISDIRAVTTIELPQGGGGSSTGAVTRFIRLAPTSVTTIQNNDPIYIHFFYSCVDPSAGSFEGQYSLTDKNGVQLLSGSINSGDGTETVTAWPQGKEDGQIYNDGYGSIDVAPYCILGKNTFNLIITTGTGESYTRTWSVDIKQLNIESTAPESIAAEIGNTIDLSYVPYGAMQKTLIVKVDGVQVKTESLGAGVTGTEQVCTIPAQSVAGAHSIELQLMASINGETKYSSSIIRDYIWYDATATDTIIISSPYRNTQLTTTQYSELIIPYTIYKANTNNFTVEYYYEDEVNPFDTVVLNNTNSGTIRYIPLEASLEDSQQSTSTNKVYIPNHITLKVEDTTLTFNFVATPMQIDIAPVAGEVIDFNPTTLNNNSANRLPSYLSVSDNFNWSSNWEGENQDSGGGYRTDEDGKCFVIKAGTYAEIDYKMFKQRNVDAGDGTTLTTSSVFNTGAEMKIIFKVTDVRDASAIWFTNTGKFTAQDDTEVGIQLSAHEGWLKTDKASNLSDDEIELPAEYQDKVWSKTKAYAVDDIVVYKSIIYKCIKAIAAPAEGEENSWNKKAWQSLGQLETEISATNSYLYFPYSEDDKIELDININQQGNNQNFIMSYEDGVPSKAYPYNYSSGGDILYHVLNNESVIRIGSPDCDVHIYRLRIYNKSLSTNEILKNFIADGATIDERVARYDRNSIYYSPELNNGEGGYTPYKTGAATLDPYRLAERIPDVKVLMLDTPRFTTGKKDFVKGSTLRCIQASGGKAYPANLEKDNWYFFNGYHAGQGTTSDNYGQSARNVDFLFECDGTHAPTKKGNLASTDFPDANYISAVAIGADASVYDEREKTWSVATGITPDQCTDWKGDHCKISLTHIHDGQAVNDDTSVPNNYFNLKVNVASSENVNNALFQKRYNDFLPYTSPAKNRDSRIKNDMEFVPAILFIRERDNDLSTHKEFNDTNWHFYALGNIGDSKKTDYTRAYDPDDMNEFTIEISDNNTANSQFQSGVFLSDPTDNSTATVETQTMADDPNIDQDPMKYIYPITSEQWNAKDSNDQYINYRHKTLLSEEFDGDHSFEFRYACKGDYRDGDLINDTNGISTVLNTDPETMAEKPYLTNDDVQYDINKQVWYAFYEWIVTATKEQFRNEAALWFVPSAIEFYYAFTHYYTMMDNRAKNTFWHFAKTGTRRAIPIGRAVPALFHIYEESDGNGGYQKASGTFDNTKQYYTQYAFDLWVYDTDTACGIDNNGELSFPYGKEDMDYRVAGQPTSGWAFNGSGSIFWRRLSASNADGGFEEEISALMRQEDDNCFSTAQHLINQFDEFQNCFPEEIWRLDIERKYIRTFTGLSYDNSITANKQNIRFLRAMMQGRKKYQRRQWVRNQAVYFGSKYGLSNVRTAEHTIEFNIYTPSGTLAVPVDQSQLVIKPYQDMYIDVAVGNSTTNLSTQDFKRAKAGERVIVDCRSGGSAQETRVYIFGGEHIAALENLAPMYTYSGSFGQGKRLKVLDLGSDNANYSNPRFTSISINENMPLLETFSVKNCSSLAQSIDLHLSNNLRVFEADGSLITGVSLPAYSNIETLHLPTTVTSVVLNSARALDDFYIKNKSTGEIDYSNLITLNINDSDYSENIDWMDIASQTLNEKINWLYLQNLSIASINDISELDAFDDKKKALEVNYGDDGELIKHIILSGMLKVTGEWSAVEKDYYGGQSTSVWPTLELDTTEGTEVTRYKIIYKYDSSTNNGAEIYSTYITPTQGSTTLTIPEIYNSNASYSTISQPTKDSTKQESYIFGTLDNEGVYNRYSGWRIAGSSSVLTNQTAVISLGNIGQDNTITIETVFNSVARTYPVKWYLRESDTNPIYISQSANGNIREIEYGGNYDGHIPTVQDINAISNNTNIVRFNGNYVGYRIFNGWQKAPVNLTLNDNEDAYKIYANWISVGLNADDTVNNTITTNSIIGQEGLSIEKVLILSKSASLRTSDNIDTNDRMKVSMGYDGLPGGQLLTAANGLPSRYTGNTSPDETTVIPFNSTNDAFTLVLDYKFDTNYSGYSSNTTEAILAGCYEERGGAKYGFRLYMDPTTGYVKVGFGDTTTSTYTKVISDPATSQYRNIIVLRHPKNSNTLYIYSGINYNMDNSTMNIYNNITDDGYEQTLTWNNITTNAKLVLGSITTGTLPPQTEDARGTIYWAKYWNADLGAGECRQLAAWPHEIIEFAVEDYDGMTNRLLYSVPGYTLPNITFTAMNLSSYIGPVYRRISEKDIYTNGEFVGWNNSWYQNFSNQKFFFGLPIALQSILVKTPIYSHQLQYDGTAFRSYNSAAALTQDYIFFPSYGEISRENNNYTSEVNKVYEWNKDNNIEIYNYNSNNQKFNTTADTSTGRKKFMNLRFPYKAINMYETATNNYTVRIFNNYDNSASVYTTINSSGFTILPGDIFIKATDNVAYMYVSASDITAGAPIMPNNGIFTCTTGGWVRAEYWWTRSTFDEDFSQRTYGAFIFVTPNATSNTTASRLNAALSNYNNHPIEALQHNAIGGCMLGSFGI